MYDIHKDLALPEDLGEVIQSGIQKGRAKKRRSNIRKYASLVTVLTITLFVASIRLSPVFAQVIASIPGFEHLVQFINGDKGLEPMIQNQYIQAINRSAEAKGIKFTVKDIIVDKTSLIVFYTYTADQEYEKKYANIGLNLITLTDSSSQEIKVGGMTYDHGTKENGVCSGRIDISLFNHEGFIKLPDQVWLNVQFSGPLRESEIAAKSAESTMFDRIPDEVILEEPLKIAISIDSDRFDKQEKVYPLNQTISVQNQKITFKQLIVYPTRIQIDVSYDQNNSMKLTGFRELKLVDEKGEAWSWINGLSGIGYSDDKTSLFFQSNYFTMPKKLTLIGSTLCGVEKNNNQVIIDLEKKRLLRTIDDRLEIKEIKMKDNYLYLDFTLRVNQNDNHGYSLIGDNLVDGKGQELTVEESGTMTGGMEDHMQTIHYKIKFEDEIQSPISFEVFNYPNLISEPFEIQVLK